MKKHARHQERRLGNGEVVAQVYQRHSLAIVDNRSYGALRSLADDFPG